MTMKNSTIQSALDQAAWVTSNLPIRLFGDPALTKPCGSITKKEIESGQALEWANQMVEFLKTFRQEFGVGRGLAANQIGIQKQMVLVWLDEEPKIYINPKIISTQGKAVYPESCISIASLIIGDVIRPWKIKIEYTNLAGRQERLKVNPIHSRLLQHEIDHLGGILCSDKYISGTTRLASGNKDDILKSKVTRIK